MQTNTLLHSLHAPANPLFSLYAPLQVQSITVAPMTFSAMPHHPHDYTTTIERRHPLHEEASRPLLPPPILTVNHAEIAYISCLAVLWWDECDNFMFIYKINPQIRFICEKVLKVWHDKQPYIDTAVAGATVRDSKNQQTCYCRN